ncbi:MAG: flavodoxin family protein [Desulfobacteraceae bacterium]|jgi:multimeric flavodoxin WrbA
MVKLLGISSSHRVHGSHAMYDSLSSVMLQSVMEGARAYSEECVTEIIHLGRMNIQPCRGCFSDIETRCHYLCDCYDDDFAVIAQKIIESDGVIFGSPTYMFGMSSTLKRFFERWISFKAPAIDRQLANKSLDECFDLMDQIAQGIGEVSNPLQGKVGGVVVAGSELGQDTVAKDIMLMLNLYGFILPPQAFIYHTGHSMQSMEEVRQGFNENLWLLHAAENLARTVVQLVQLTKGHSWPEMPKVLHKDDIG